MGRESGLAGRVDDQRRVPAQADDVEFPAVEQLDGVRVDVARLGELRFSVMNILMVPSLLTRQYLARRANPRVGQHARNPGSRLESHTVLCEEAAHHSKPFNTNLVHFVRYWPRDGRLPINAYLVCSTQRSGSTYL